MVTPHVGETPRCMPPEDRAGKPALVGEHNGRSFPAWIPTPDDAHHSPERTAHGHNTYITQTTPFIVFPKNGPEIGNPLTDGH